MVTAISVVPALVNSAPAELKLVLATALPGPKPLRPMLNWRGALGRFGVSLDLRRGTRGDAFVLWIEAVSNVDAIESSLARPDTVRCADALVDRLITETLVDNGDSVLFNVFLCIADDLRCLLRAFVAAMDLLMDVLTSSSNA